MKTIQEVEKWCDGAAEQFGDPSLPVCQLFVRHVRGDHRPKSSDEALQLFCFQEAGEFVLWLGPQFVVPISISPDGPKTNATGELEEFGVEEISSGVWALNPSLNIPGELHAFVILYDVPTPAPWGRLIVLAG